MAPFLIRTQRLCERLTPRTNKIGRLSTSGVCRWAFLCVTSGEMELRQLRHFLSIVKHGNLHRAARELHLSQQGLSASIARLEDTLGAPLFERGRHGATLTRYGETFLPRARSIVAESRIAFTEIQEIRDTTRGQIRVGVGTYFAYRIASSALIDVVSDYPNIDISVVDGASADLFAALARSELDFVVASPADGAVMPEGVESEVLFETTDELYMSCSHPLAGRAQIELSDLLDYCLIMSARFEFHRASLDDVFRAAGLPPPAQIVRTDSVPIIGAMLHTTKAVALLGRAPGDGRLKLLGELKTFDIPQLASPYRGVLAWRRTSLVPAALRLMQRFRERTREVLEGKDNSGRFATVPHTLI